MTSNHPGEPAPSAGTTATTEAVTELLRPFQEEATATRLAIEDRAAAQRRINAWLISFIMVTVLLVGMVLWVLVQDGQRRAQSRQILRNNTALSEQIADCTRPTGKCYQQNQTRLQDTITRLIESNIYIAQCARKEDTSEAELRACVLTHLSQLTPTPTPSAAR